ncbi:sensor histidine kinase [Kitasatospora sp. NPDC088346]|uniref:sensor histidine kinase n=1 Tax=Kitasatospora sp. NPDC088346 TaxID=3364073 RepID=UPI00381C822C
MASATPCAARPRADAEVRAVARLSLRARLLVLALLLVTTGLVVSDTLVLGAVKVQLVDRADQQLERFAQPLTHRSPGRTNGPLSGLPGAPTGPRSGPRLGQGDGTGAGGRRPGPFLPSQYVVQYLGADGAVQEVFRQPIDDSDPLPKVARLTPAAISAHGGDGFTVPGEQGTGSWRVLVLPLQRGAGGGGPGGGGPGGGSGGGSGGGLGTGGGGGQGGGAAADSADFSAPGYLMVAVSLDDVDAVLARLRTTFLTIGGAVLLGIAGLGAFAVRAGLRPLRQIERGAQRIAAGELSHRMPDLGQRTEIGRLSAALNGMLSQIEAAFSAQAASEARMRRFVADASHELRTPLAGIRGFAELHRMGALRDVDRAMDRIETEAIRLGGLVEDLLTLARLDEERPLDLAPMDLRTLAADALHDLTALDPGRPVALTGPDGAGAPQPAPVLGDEARLRQVVSNLVGNAVRHTPAGTAVRIGVGTADGRCLLEVVDQGPGLTDGQAAQVFERFYRVDASRSRLEGGGAGLGLAIASALVHAHGGALTLDSAPGRGASFRVQLPHQR